MLTNAVTQLPCMAQLGINDGKGDVVLIASGAHGGKGNTPKYHLPDDDGGPLCWVDHTKLRRVKRNTIPWHELCTRCKERE